MVGEEQSSQQSKYIGVIFDCVQVCLTDGAQSAIPTLADILKVKDAAIKEAIRGDHREEFYKGQKNVAEYWDGVIKKLDMPLVIARQKIAEHTNRHETEVELKEVAETLESRVLGSYEEVREVTSVLEQLHQKGYRLGMISNSPVSRGIYWTDKFGFLKVFEGRIRLSGQYNEKKPEVLRKLLNLVTEEMGGGILPSQIVYVDDKLKNVEAAVAEVGGGIWLPPEDGKGSEEVATDQTPTNPRITRTTREMFGQTLRDAYGFKL